MRNNDIKTDNESKMKEEVERYKDVEGITTKKLNFGVWYVEHREQFKKILIGFLTAVAVVSWLYTLYGFFYYAIWGMKQDRLSAYELAKTNVIGHDYIARISAKDLQISATEVLKSSSQKYDFIAKIKNPNQKWRSEFSYYFYSGDKRTETLQGFILPGEEKYLVIFNQDFSGGSAVRLAIENIGWSRINQHKIPDWASFSAGHLNIVVKDIVFTPANKSGLTDKINLNQLGFAAINKTAYNYREVDFVVLLYSGSAVIGVNKYKLKDFMSGEERQIQANWPGALGRVSKVEVIPEVNIMDDGAYLKFEGGVGEIK
jgi:hypothetical protein